MPNTNKAIQTASIEQDLVNFTSPFPVGLLRFTKGQSDWTRTQSFESFNFFQPFRNEVEVLASFVEGFDLNLVAGFKVIKTSIHFPVIPFTRN